MSVFKDHNWLLTDNKNKGTSSFVPLVTFTIDHISFTTNTAKYQKSAFPATKP